MHARRTRVTRGVLAAAVSTFAAAFSHGVASGEAPSVVALATASVLAVFVCIVLAARATPLRIAAAVILSQAAFHTLFTLAPATTGSATTGTATTGTATTGTGAGAAHGSHALVMLTTDAVAHAHASADTAMWLGHAAAAVVTVLSLLRGERAALAVFDSLRLTVRALLGRVSGLPVLTTAPALPGWPAAFSATTALQPSSVRRRGPPAARRTFSRFA